MFVSVEALLRWEHKELGMKAYIQQNKADEIRFDLPEANTRIGGNEAWIR
ncbi:hypothetical protein [Fictibacillus terranigra]|uniref:Uncharacterized protein n=1 Tax=Fictibacillus terranigra TaxID=3058424 RepID=A0ABT8E245_9BACL|nr:hypothetical protein [Fictibacillus sp. CENA-BCM004]MDN4071951.1 hypothetical protein [Fictibacillus sp. CENA-BCM004]